MIKKTPTKYNEYRAKQGIIIAMTIESYISPYCSIFLFVFSDGGCQVTVNLESEGWTKCFSRVSNGLHEMVQAQKRYSKGDQRIASLIKEGYHKWFTEKAIPNSPQIP